MNGETVTTCKICKSQIVTPGFLGHIKRLHKREYEAWIHSRSDFGISIFEHLELKNIDIAMIRQ